MGAARGLSGRRRLKRLGDADAAITPLGVYVDALRAHPVAAIQPAARRYGQRWCHMIADTDDELHEMADKLGMRRAWFQGDHYDLVPSKRGLAIRFGAIPLERREFFTKLREYRVGCALSKIGLSGAAKAVYVALLKRALSDVALVAIATLGDDTALTRAVVKRALDELWTHGQIDVLGRQGYGGVNEYILRGPSGRRRSAAAANIIQRPQDETVAR